MKPFNVLYFLVSVGLALGGALVFEGCPTMIPPTDTTLPRIELRISGPGIIGTKIMSNPPRERWTAADGSQYFDLDPSQEYNFILLVSDQGGVRRANLRMPVEFRISDLSPPGVRNEEGPIQRSLTIFGNNEDPRTGLVISGSFTASLPPGEHDLSFEFQTEADDFGGQTSRVNQRFMNVVATVGFGTP